MAKRYKNADATAKILGLIILIPILPVAALGYGVWLVYRYFKKKKSAAHQKTAEPYLTEYDLRKKFGAEYDRHAALLAYIAASPLFSGNDVAWIAPYVEQADIFDGRRSGNEVARMIRFEGTPLPASLKKECGYRANFRIGERFFNILSEAGKANPVYASEHIVNWSLNDKFNHVQRKVIEHRKRPARFSAIDDGDTCDHGVRLHGQIFEHNDLPDLPLPGCDAEQCRCHLQIHFQV